MRLGGDDRDPCNTISLKSRGHAAAEFSCLPLLVLFAPHFKKTYFRWSANKIDLNFFRLDFEVFHYINTTMVQTALYTNSRQCPPPFYNNFQKPLSSFTMDFAQQLPLQRVDQNTRLRQSTAKPIKPKPIAAHLLHQHCITPYSPQSASIQRRNARERNRVKQVNDGFSNLRQHIPHEVVAALTTTTTAAGASTTTGRSVNRKLSKVDTLKLTVEYIRRLQETLMMADAVQDTSQGSQTLGPNEYNAPEARLFSVPYNSYVLGAVSPAPSTVSSSDMSTNSYGATSNYAMAGNHHQHSEFKHESYDDSSDPQDDEILDCISWWQQQ